VINTGTTIVTFLMAFLIQHTQNRDTLAMHLKLDELEGQKTPQAPSSPSPPGASFVRLLIGAEHGRLDGPDDPQRAADDEGRDRTPRWRLTR
jgi:hypothetical protein